MYRTVITEDDRKNVPFKVLPGPRGLMVADLDEIAKKVVKERKEKKMSMLISLQPIDEHRFIDPNWFLSFCKDPLTSIYYGNIDKMYDDGNPKWRRIFIHEYLNINLERPEEAKVFAILRMHPSVKGSPLQMEYNDSPILKIFDPEEEASKKISKSKNRVKALTRAVNVRGETMIRAARMYGIRIIDTMSPKEISGAIASLADTDPDMFNQKWDDTDRVMKEDFATAIDCNIIKVIQGKGYFFGDILLGSNESSAIAYLKKETDITLSIGRDIATKDKQQKRLLKEIEELKKEGKDEDEEIV